MGTVMSCLTSADSMLEGDLRRVGKVGRSMRKGTGEEPSGGDGSSISEANARSIPPHQVKPQKTESKWRDKTSVPMVPSVADTVEQDVVVMDRGRLVRKRKMVAKGAAANLAELIVEAFELANKAIHSMQPCYALVTRLVMLQQRVWTDKRLLANGTLMLQLQEAAMEVVHMNKLFSNSGWLARLNRSDVDDEVEFTRLTEFISALQEKCDMHKALGMTIRDIRSSDSAPSSSQLQWHLKKVGGLHTLANKSRAELKDFVNRFAPLLSVRSCAVGDLLEQEIKIAASSEISGPHTAIRHHDLRLFWYSHMQLEEVSWDLFWKYFPGSLQIDSNSPDDTACHKSLAELLKSDANKSQFKEAVHRIGNGSYVTTVEIDYAFPPNKTVQECVQRILDISSELPKRSTRRDSWPSIWSTANSFDPQIAAQEIAASDGIPEDKGYIGEICGLPGSGSKIIGRDEEIQSLCETFEAGQRAVGVVGIHGIGKSAVAAAVADELLSSKTWRTAHWINLVRVETVDDAAARITAALGVPLHMTSVTNVQRLKNWLKLKGPTQACSGWVLDGIDSLLLQSSASASFFGLLTQLMRHAPNLQLLLTCRAHPELRESHQLQKVLQLDELDDDDALSLTESLFGGGISKMDANCLVNSCGGVPLALRIVGGCVVTGVCSLLELLDSVKDSHCMSMSEDSDPMLLPLFDGGITAQVPNSKLHNAIKTGISCLTYDERHALHLLSDCPVEFSVENAAAVLEMPQRLTNICALLWRLMNRGFLRFIPSDGMYTFEYAVYEFLQKPQPERKAPTRRRGSSFVRSPYNDPNVVDREAAKAGLFQYYAMLLERALIVHQTGSPLSTMRLLEQDRAGLELFVLWLVKDTIVLRSLPRGSVKQILILAATLCEVLVEVGVHFFSAVQRTTIIDAVFSITEKTRGQQNCWEWYNARLGLAKSLIANGQASEAEDVLDDLERSLELGGDGEDESRALGELLVMKGKIRHLTGRFQEAEQLYLDGLAAQKNQHGAESVVVSRSLSKLAAVQQGLNHLNDARKSYDDSLKIQKKQKDRNIIEMATAFHNLASLHQHCQRHSEAEKLYTKSLKLREKYVGHFNVEVAFTLGSLAAVKVSQGEHEVADQLYRKAIAMLKEILGEDHIAVANLSTKLAVLLESHGAGEEAEKLYVDALEVKAKTLGSLHDQVLRMVGRIQRVMTKTAEYAVAGTTAIATEGMTAWNQYLTPAGTSKIHLPVKNSVVSGEEGTPRRSCESIGLIRENSSVLYTAEDLFVSQHEVGEQSRERCPLPPSVRNYSQQLPLERRSQNWDGKQSPNSVSAGVKEDKRLSASVEPVQCSDRSSSCGYSKKSASSSKRMQHQSFFSQSTREIVPDDNEDGGFECMHRTFPPVPGAKMPLRKRLFNRNSKKRDFVIDTHAGQGFATKEPRTRSVVDVASSLMSSSGDDRHRVDPVASQLSSESEASSSPSADPPLLDSAHLSQVSFLSGREQHHGKDRISKSSSETLSNCGEVALTISKKLDDVAEVLADNTSEAQHSFGLVRASRPVDPSLYDLPNSIPKASESGSVSMSAQNQTISDSWKNSKPNMTPSECFPFDLESTKPVSNSTCLSMTVEQDLLESTVSPALFDSLQSIVHPMYNGGPDGFVSADSAIVSGALVTTYVSLDV